jgi:hypothetical protein
LSRERQNQVAASDSGEPESPSEQATLQIRSTPVDITVSTRGPKTTSVALGAFGPAITIAVGGIVGFPVWAITVICVLQIAMAYLRRRGT